MKRNTRKTITLVAIIALAFFWVYELGFLPWQNGVGIVQAQQNQQYERCYALRTPSIGYDEFNEGNVDEEESINLPPGWHPVGFTLSKTSSSGRALTLVCGPKTL